MAEERIGRKHISVGFARIDEDAIAPTRGSELAAGWDLYALEDTTVPKGSTTKIRTGIVISIPDGWEGQIRCRSSLGAKGMMLPNGVGTIDADYRGEIGVILVNLSNEDFTIEHGERIAQLVIAKHERAVWEEVEELGETSRGAGGFGSTGVK